MKWFLSLVSKKTEYSAMQFSIRTWLLWRERKSKHYPWDTIIKKIRMRVWNLADIWQHWDGKGGGLYTDYRRDSPHHLPPRIRLVGVRQEGSAASDWWDRDNDGPRCAPSQLPVTQDWWTRLHWERLRPVLQIHALPPFFLPLSIYLFS